MRWCASRGRSAKRSTFSSTAITREDWVIGGAPEYARSRTNPEEPGEAGEGG